MADRFTKEKRTKIMSSIHSANTKPEVELRQALWHRGFRYRLNVKKLPGTPDIVLPKYRTAIFMHGCFWHGHLGCKIYHLPKTNTDFWRTKVRTNQERDQRVWRQLEAKGWYVVIVWECELTKSKFHDTVERVATEIVSNGEIYNHYLDERRKERIRWRQERKDFGEHRRKLEKELDKCFEI